MKPVHKLLTFYHQARLLYFRALEPSILGVRALIVRDDQVMLVRHTYQPGWYLPGGRVDRGETAHRAMCREVEEECGLLVRGARLMGIYSNRELNRNDHIMLYVVEDFAQGRMKRRYRLEIDEARFFPIAELPEGTTPATRRRLRELAGDRPSDEYW
jgi:ADP-ribose pyrophosphatase YjhB (NUDIX family)